MPMNDRSIFVIQKPEIEKLVRYERNGVSYAGIPAGTKIVATLTGWDFLLPDGAREAVGGHPMVLKP